MSVRQRACDVPQFDASVLPRMVGDDRAVQQRIVLHFLEVLTCTEHELGASLEDAAALGRIAHRFKSTSRMVGLERLGSVCEVLESRAGDGESAQDLAPLARQVIQLCRQGAEVLRAAFAVS